MRHSSVDELIKELTARADALLLSKGREYGDADDDLHNFKRPNNMGLTITPATVAWIYASKHLESVLKYVKNDTLEVGTEPAIDRFADLINYLRLVYCCLVEADRQREASDDPADYPSLEQITQLLRPTSSNPRPGGYEVPTGYVPRRTE